MLDTVKNWLKVREGTIQTLNQLKEDFISSRRGTHVAAVSGAVVAGAGVVGAIALTALTGGLFGVALGIGAAATGAATTVGSGAVDALLTNDYMYAVKRSLNNDRELTKDIHLKLTSFVDFCKKINGIYHYSPEETFVMLLEFFYNSCESLGTAEHIVNNIESREDMTSSITQFLLSLQNTTNVLQTWIEQLGQAISDAFWGNPPEVVAKLEKVISELEEQRKKMKIIVSVTHNI